MYFTCIPSVTPDKMNIGTVGGTKGHSGHDPSDTGEAIKRMFLYKWYVPFRSVSHCNDPFGGEGQNVTGPTEDKI